MIDSGIAPECYSTPNSAAVNMGPRYSSDGAVQYALAQHVSKIVFDQSNVPGTGYIAAGPAALAKDANVPITQLTENVPITDASSVAIKEVDDAGPNGAVVLNFTPPEALVILQAAQKLGLENRVKLWACSTPCNTDFLAQSLGPKWNGKLFVNAELTPPDGTSTAAMNLYKAILKQYGTSVQGGIGSFSQMGFTEAEIAVHALESISGPYTVQSVNAAFKAVKDFDTGMLCQLWTYGDYPLHIPNNSDYTVTPKDGKMVTAQGCTPISSVDPQIAQYRSAAGTAANADQHDPGAALVMPRWAGLRAVHRQRPGPGRGVRPVRGRAGRPVPGHRRALPGLRRGRRDGRADRLVADHHAGAPGWVGWLACVAVGGGGDARLRDGVRPGRWPSGIRWSRRWPRSG